jgi:phytoene dehydrogenase-like protein
MNESVIIIGGGMAGLAVGSYLQMNGFDTEIFEMQDFPGGLCTSWKRKEYLVDGCIRYMTGVSEGESSYNAWKHLVDMDSLEVYYPPEHAAFDDPENGRVVVWSDADKLKEELLRIAPNDGKVIGQLIANVKKYGDFRPIPEKPAQTMGFAEKTRQAFSQIGWSPSFYQLAGKSNRSFSEELSTPGLKKIFTNVFEPEQSLLSTILILSNRHSKTAGYPLGGSLFLARQMEKRYLSLGGSIHYNAEVKRIEVIKGRATGVVASDNERYRAGIIISAVDGYQTLYGLMNGRYLDQTLKERYKKVDQYISGSAMYVSLGIHKPMEELPHRLFFPVRQPFDIDPSTRPEYLDMMHYSHDPISAPKGKTLVTFLIPLKSWKYWWELSSSHRDNYKATKQLAALNIIEAMDNHFGDIKTKVGMIDVATPVTYYRYSRNLKGAIYGWNETPRISGYPAKFSIKGLDNFFMTGQWASAGGLNNVVMNGYHLSPLICHDREKDFRVEGS